MCGRADAATATWTGFDADVVKKSAGDVDTYLSCHGLCARGRVYALCCGGGAAESGTASGVPDGWTCARAYGGLERGAAHGRRCLHWTS